MTKKPKAQEPTTLAVTPSVEARVVPANVVTHPRRQKMVIREYSDVLDRAAVIELWSRVFGSSTGHNEPSFSIDQKLRMRDGLFFVAATPSVVGTVMAGYDGHRGWIYSVAVNPDSRRRRIGTALLRHAEAALQAKGCVKVNLQIVEANADAVKFYEQIGYAVEPRISMGKKLQQPL